TMMLLMLFFFFQAEDGIRDLTVTGVQTCALPISPKRRTMVQLRVGRPGLADLPLVDDTNGTFYFKGEGDRTLWLSPHDEIATDRSEERRVGKECRSGRSRDH